MADEVEPFFLFLGESDREGVTSKLKAAGSRYEKKRLDSSVSNWESIISYFEDDELFEKPALAGVLVKLTAKTLLLLVDPPYSSVADRLLACIRHVPHIIFVHESFFQHGDDHVVNDETDEFYYGQFFGNINEPTKDRIISMLSDHNLELVPYKTNAELSVLAMEFIDGSERNLVLRLYVPTGRMWAGEMEKLLRLFRDYLNQVAGLHVRQEQYATAQGVIYEFYGDARFDPSTLPREFEEFSRFLDACAVSSDAGHQVLAASGLDARTVEEIVHKYAKEAKRLHVDLKQERERKILSIRHQLESELTDYVRTEAEWEEINRLVDLHVPRLSGVSAALGIGRHTVPSGRQTASIIVNIETQVVGDVQGVVAREVSGTSNIGVQASELLSLIREFGSANAPHLASDVYELEDNDARSENRVTARQRLKGFLYTLGGKITDKTLDGLLAYVQGRLPF